LTSSSTANIWLMIWASFGIFFVLRKSKSWKIWYLLCWFMPEGKSIINQSIWAEFRSENLLAFFSYPLCFLLVFVIFLLSFKIWCENSHLYCSILWNFYSDLPIVTVFYYSIFLYLFIDILTAGLPKNNVIIYL
jgi:hypothetical protein